MTVELGLSGVSMKVNVHGKGIVIINYYDATRLTMRFFALEMVIRMVFFHRIIDSVGCIS